MTVAACIGAERAPAAFRHSGQPWWFVSTAALVVLLLGASWMKRGNEVQSLATAVGQQRTIKLIDGSIVALNTNTIVDTDLSSTVRQIYLRKGEAHFQVAHDRRRPFLVHAGDAIVRAVGTQFDVRVRDGRNVDVLVSEGRVEVERAGQAAAGAVGNINASSIHTLHAGEQLSTAAPDIRVTALSRAQLSSELAWHEGAIIFDGEPLSSAVSEIERYTDARIVVSDAHVGALPVGGRVRTDDVQSFLDGLQARLPVAIRRGADGQVYIEAR